MRTIAATTFGFLTILAIVPLAMAQSYGCVSVPSGLTIGSRGSQVLSLQQFLSTNLYGGGASWMQTGYYGQSTAAAVRTFQAYRGLSQTGWVDASTASAIWSASCQGGYGGYGYGNYSYSYPYTYQYQTPTYTYPGYQYYQNYGYNQYPYNNYYGYNDCRSGYGYNSYCNTYDDHRRSPVIHVTGPTSLDEDEQGSWKIYIDEDNGDDLDLTVDWGDDSSDSKFRNISDRKTVTHRYDDDGTYTIRFKVTDEDDRTFTYTLTVDVDNDHSDNDREEVTIDDDDFSPRTLRIDRGTRVTWTNEDNEDHTVTSDTGRFESGRLEEDETYSLTFNTRGTYYYHCRFHPDMTGTIIVD